MECPAMRNAAVFLYLHEKLADPKGKLWKMAGVIRGEAAPKEKTGTVWLHQSDRSGGRYVFEARREDPRS